MEEKKVAHSNSYLMKPLYLLPDCNGAGKTTAAYALLTDLLDTRGFANADEIARGLSTFHPETVSS